MRVAILVLLLAGCTDLIAPDDREWLESCVFTLSQDTPFTISREELSKCSEIKFQVVNFCGFDSPEAVVEWLP